MSKIDVKDKMIAEAKKAKLDEGETLINMYSKQEMESLGGDGNPYEKGKKFHIHPNHVDHLIKKGFAKKIGEAKTEVPNLDEKKEHIYIQA